MITVISICKNEAYLAPFFLRHYERIADRIIIYDNASTDETREILRAHPKVSLRQFETDGMDDGVHLNIKNGTYKTLPGEWFINVDFDEFIWHPDLSKYLDQCLLDGTTLPCVDGWNMIGDETPTDGLLTEKIVFGVKERQYSKSAVVHRDVDVRYAPGCHICNPIGRVKSARDAQIKLLHYNWISKEYGLARRKQRATEQSKRNKDLNRNYHYNNIAAEERYYDGAKQRRVRAICGAEVETSRFTKNYFTYQSFYDMIARKDFKTFVEIGVWKGHSVSYLAQRLIGRDVKIHAVDLFDDSPFNGMEKDENIGLIYNANLATAGVRDRIVDIKERSDLAAARFDDASVDFVFIDADHAYDAVKKDIDAWLPKVRNGGIVSGHDAASYGVATAIREKFGTALKFASGDVWYVEV